MEKTTEKPQKWHSILIEASKDDSEMLSTIMFSAGCSGIVEEGSTITTITLKSYFPGEQNISILLEKLTNEFKQLSVTATIQSACTIGFNAKNTDWRQHFKPFEIAPQIIVAPSWENYSIKNGEALITLDPGMAFGTGLHETTRLCAKAMHSLKLAHPKLDCFLDVGCGSGILSLTANKLGFITIEAVEIDKDAIEVAHENFRINQIEPISIHLSLGEVKPTFSLVVANILLNTLLYIKDDLSQQVANNGYLILSGIMHQQKKELVAAYEELGFTCCEQTDDGEWSCVILHKQQ